jgi:hypothetical protein
MKRKYLYLIITLAVIAAFAAYYFVMAFTLPVYSYESSDKGFDDIEVPWKGRTLLMVEASFEKYKGEQDNPDLKLYRTSTRIWHAPNLWIDNLTNRRWEIPFREPTATGEGDNNLYLYKVMTKADGINKPPTTLRHDENINIYFSKRDDIEPRSQVVINNFTSVATITNIDSDRKWRHAFTIHYDPTVINVAGWKNKNRVSTGCIVYKNKIVGLIHFGSQWKENAFHVYIAADKDGEQYLKAIFQQIENNKRVHSDAPKGGA